MDCVCLKWYYIDYTKLQIKIFRKNKLFSSIQENCYFLTGIYSSKHWVEMTNIQLICFGKVKLDFLFQSVTWKLKADSRLYVYMSHVLLFWSYGKLILIYVSCDSKWTGTESQSWNWELELLVLHLVYMLHGWQYNLELGSKTWNRGRRK